MSEGLAISTHIRGLYNSSEFSDLVLILRNGKQLKVHKSVVCRSPFFRAACSSGFKESHENVIHFPEDPPDALEILIMLLYGFSWFEARTEVWFKRVNKYTWPVLLLPDTYELACKYQLHDVSKQLIEELKSTLRHLTNLGPGQNGWFWTLADYIYEADHNMPDIRVELIRTLRRHANSLHGKREFVKEKLEICPGLAVELALTGGLGENGFIV